MDGSRRLDIGAILADDKMSCFILVGRRSGHFGKMYSTIYRWIKACCWHSDIRVPQADNLFSGCCPLKQIPLTSKVADESFGHRFFSKISDMSNHVCRPIRGLFGRPDKSSWLNKRLQFQLVGQWQVGHDSSMGRQKNLDNQHINFTMLINFFSLSSACFVSPGTCL